ncbi:hypothetical protein PLICRDRAFT_41008 [Plicaturopsis crispa FD-325 SS-3]|nr:hypothetical protein PLICRDRAFT_41008 [Plicaturopsis crispa FD-325 SS-3]
MRSKSQRLIDYHSLAVAAHYKVPVRHRQRSKHWLLFRWTLTGNTHAWKNARIQDAYRYYVIITAMASKNPALTRGTACRQCRKRKMRCDGLRPSCTPCRKTHRQDDCEYDDRKSRTQMLQEKITLLESRIQELERQPSGSISPGPSSLRGSSMHTDFHKSSDSSSPPTEEGAPVVEFQDFSAMEWEPSPFLDVPEIPPSDTPFYMAGLQYEHRTPASALHSLAEETPQDLGPDPHVWNFGGTNIDASTSTAERGESGSTPASWSADCDLPSASKEILLDTFLSHRQQCYFEFVGNTNRHTLTALVSPHQQPHPALKHAIFLLACHFARSPWFSGVEPKLFDKTLREINDALQHSDRLLDVVQASCLVAVYLFIKSRPLEGYYHSYSAARLAVGLGFSHHTQNADILSTNFEKKPELKDHALVSRQVFMIDRLWTIAYGLPPAFPGDLSPWINEVADSDPEQPQMAEVYRVLFTFCPGDSLTACPCSCRPR